MLSPEYNAEQRAILLRVARESICRGLVEGRPLLPDPGHLVEALRALRATFVTLRRHGALRGCTGSLEPVRPLVKDVAHSAFQSAFLDPRFNPLAEAELEQIAVEISVLSPLQRMRVRDEQDLLRQIQPGVDGLMIQESGCSATFLPKVWDQLADPEAFLVALKQKAGLPGTYWSSDMAIYRYHTETFGDEDAVRDEDAVVDEDAVRTSG